MIITTELKEEEKRIIRDQYNQTVSLKKEFPHYVHMDALVEKIRVLEDLFGPEFFKD